MNMQDRPRWGFLKYFKKQAGLADVCLMLATLLASNNRPLATISLWTSYRSGATPDPSSSTVLVINQEIENPQRLCGGSPERGYRTGVVGKAT